MKENRLTPAESFSLGNGVRGALIARTGSVIASGGSAVCCWTAGSCSCDCRAAWDCGFCPIASANMQSSAWADARNGLNIFFPIGYLGWWIRETARAVFTSYWRRFFKAPSFEPCSLRSFQLSVWIYSQEIIKEPNLVVVLISR